MTFLYISTILFLLHYSNITTLVIFGCRSDDRTQRASTSVLDPTLFPCSPLWATSPFPRLGRVPLDLAVLPPHWAKARLQPNLSPPSSPPLCNWTPCVSLLQPHTDPVLSSSSSRRPTPSRRIHLEHDGRIFQKPLNRFEEISFS